MNILFVTPFFHPQTGGVATYVEEIQRALCERGHKVLVLRPGDSDSISPCPYHDDASVFQFYMRPMWFSSSPIKGLAATIFYFLPTLWRLSRFLAHHNVQLVCLEYPLPNVFYFPILRLVQRFRIVVGLHGDDVLSLHLLGHSDQWVVRKCIRSSDWVLAHSVSLLSQAETIVRRLGPNRSYLPLGVDISRLRAMAETTKIFHGQLISPYVLTVAKLYPRKGLDVLLQALRKVKNDVAGYRFVIAGDGPEDARLKEMAEDLKVNDIVQFLGEVPNSDIPKLLSSCEFFLLPSRSEPFGIVLLEAMAFGRAILATNVGGIPEFVVNGQNGVLIPSCNSDILASEIVQMLVDEETRSRLGMNGMKWVRQFDYPMLVLKYEQLFEKVLAPNFR